jgi:Asp-tRNA(Asn)/Glu-tRNA(Gln) amidotransferase C subunit
MDINEIAKMYSNLQRLNYNSFTDTSEVNQNYLKNLNEQQSELQNLSKISDSTEMFSKTSQILENIIDRLDNINKAFTNPVSGEEETSTQTIDTMQKNRLHDSIQNYIESHNRLLLESKTNDDVANRIKEVDLPEGLEELGVSRKDDGSLSFDKTQFNSVIEAGITTIASLNENISDAKNFISANESAINEINKTIQEKYSDTVDEINDLQQSFTEEYQKFFDTTLNRMLDNVMGSFFSSLGIGQNFSNFA